MKKGLTTIVSIVALVCCYQIVFCQNIDKNIHYHVSDEILNQLYPVALEILSNQTKNSNDATTYNLLAPIGSYTTPSSNLEKIIQELYMSYWNGTNAGFIEREYIYLKSTGLIENFKDLQSPDTTYFRIATTDIGERLVIAWNRAKVMCYNDYGDTLSYEKDIPISQKEFKLIADWNTKEILRVANRDLSIMCPQINVSLIRVIWDGVTSKTDYILYQDVIDEI